LSQQVCEKDELLGALDDLGLVHDGGMYTSLRQALTPETCSRLAGVFFNALGNVGTSRFSVRVIHAGKDLHPAQFLESRTGDGLIDHVSVKDRVLHHYLERGATVVFDHVNDHVPFAQAIQDRVEALTGSKCWVQCYITQASSSAFDMHRDDHAFVIVQLFGSKEWRHSAETVHAPEATVYSPGTVSFYPKGTPHDVHGLGEISMHLTIAFEAFDGRKFQELPEQSAESSIVRRRGSGLPYSINTALISEDTPARLAVSHVPDKAEDSAALHVWSGAGKLAVPAKFEALLHHLARQPELTPTQAAEWSGIGLEDIMNLWTFGFKNGLLHNPAQ